MNGLDGTRSFPTCALDRVSQLLDMQKVAVDRDSRQQYQLCRQPHGNFRIGIQHRLANW